MSNHPITKRLSDEISDTHIRLDRLFEQLRELVAEEERKAEERRRSASRRPSVNLALR